MSQQEKNALLEKTSYEDFLRNYAKVDEEVIAIYQTLGDEAFGVLELMRFLPPLILDYDGGMPGVEHTLPRTGL